MKTPVRSYKKWLLEIKNTNSAWIGLIFCA